MNKILPLVVLLIFMCSMFGETVVSNTVAAPKKTGCDNLPPNAPRIHGPSRVKPGTYIYSFNATDPNGDNVSYFIDWGDNRTTGWIGPFPSGKEKKVYHTFLCRGTFQIKAKAKDIYNYEGEWGFMPIIISQEYVTLPLFFRLLFERFPNALPIVRYLFGY